MKIEFKNGFAVMGGIETRISEDYWKEREESIKTRRKALNIGMKILTDSKLREKLKGLLGEFDINSF
jgi:hypothetical protein